MKLGYKITLTILGSATAAFVVSKIFVAKEMKKARERYQEPDVEKEQLIGLVLSMKGIEDNESTRQLYRNLDVQQLKDELKIDSQTDYGYDYSGYTTNGYDYTGY